MRGIKLVAIDLDDTLLRDDLTISRHSREVLREVSRRGVALTLATGRMFASARPYAEMLGFDVPLITYQGALVKHAGSGEVIYHRPLPLQVARRVIEYGREIRAQVNYYLNDRLFVERVTEHGEHYAALAGVPFNKVNDLGDLLEEGLPTKLLVIDKAEDIAERWRSLEGILRKEGLTAHLTRSKPRYLEVSHPEATKGLALRELAGRLGVRREEILAFGDGYNDLEMIEFAGTGVVVANAPEEIRRKADYVTASNNEDGVAAALERLVLRS